MNSRAQQNELVGIYKVCENTSQWHGTSLPFQSLSSFKTSANLWALQGHFYTSPLAQKANQSYLQGVISRF